MNSGKNWGRILLTILASLGVLMSGISALGQAYTMSDPEAPAFANAQGYLGALVAVYMLLFLVNICLVVLRVDDRPVNAAICGIVKLIGKLKRRLRWAS